MKLKYVGAMPVVSNKGVGFDETKPDKYTFLNAAVELIEALSYGPTSQTKHLHHVSGKSYSDDELLSVLKQHVDNLDTVMEETQKKTDILKAELIERVNEHKNLSEDGRQAWLNNIELMSDYYYQYVANERAYNSALEVLAQEIHDGRIQEVSFPMFRNYGMVLHDLLYVLEHRKSPIDGNLDIQTKDGTLMGYLHLSHR